MQRYWSSNCGVLGPFIERISSMRLLRTSNPTTPQGTIVWHSPRRRITHKKGNSLGWRADVAIRGRQCTFETSISRRPDLLLVKEDWQGDQNITRRPTGGLGSNRWIHTINLPGVDVMDFVGLLLFFDKSLFTDFIYRYQWWKWPIPFCCRRWLKLTSNRSSTINYSR